MTEDSLFDIEVALHDARYAEERLRELWKETNKGRVDKDEVLDVCSLALRHLQVEVIERLIGEIKERDDIIHDMQIETDRYEVGRRQGMKDAIAESVRTLEKQMITSLVPLQDVLDVILSVGDFGENVPQHDPPARIRAKNKRLREVLTKIADYGNEDTPFPEHVLIARRALERYT